jgi:hypothetical protein
MLECGKLRPALQSTVVVVPSGCLMHPGALAQSGNETPKLPVFDAASIKPLTRWRPIG